MYSKGIEIPKVSFSALDYNEIEPGSFFIGFNLDLGGKLCKIDSNGTLTVIEGAGGGGSVISVSDDGQGIVEVYNVDPTNPIVKFNGVETDGATVTGDGTVLNPLTASIVDSIDVTHSELVTLKSTGTLKPGMNYRITDFQTIYDQPDFNNDGTPKTNPTVKSGPVEPIIVTAISANELGVDAFQEDHPNDTIKYILEFTTPITNTSTKGRIIKRIDDKGNESDFDHRNVLFKRYMDRYGEYIECKDSIGGLKWGEFTTSQTVTPSLYLTGFMSFTSTLSGATPGRYLGVRQAAPSTISGLSDAIFNVEVKSDGTVIDIDIVDRVIGYVPGDDIPLDLTEIGGTGTLTVNVQPTNFGSIEFHCDSTSNITTSGNGIGTDFIIHYGYNNDGTPDIGVQIVYTGSGYAIGDTITIPASVFAGQPGAVATDLILTVTDVITDYVELPAIDLTEDCGNYLGDTYAFYNSPLTPDYLQNFDLPNIVLGIDGFANNNKFNGYLRNITVKSTIENNTFNSSVIDFISRGGIIVKNEFNGEIFNYYSGGEITRSSLGSIRDIRYKYGYIVNSTINIFDGLSIDELMISDSLISRFSNNTIIGNPIFNQIRITIQNSNFKSFTWNTIRSRIITINSCNINYFRSNTLGQQWYHYNNFYYNDFNNIEDCIFIQDNFSHNKGNNLGGSIFGRTTNNDFGPDIYNCIFGHGFGEASEFTSDVESNTHLQLSHSLGNTFRSGASNCTFGRWSFGNTFNSALGDIIFADELTNNIFDDNYIQIVSDWTNQIELYERFRTRVFALRQPHEYTYSIGETYMKNTVSFIGNNLFYYRSDTILGTNVDLFFWVWDDEYQVKWQEVESLLGTVDGLNESRKNTYLIGNDSAPDGSYYSLKQYSKYDSYNQGGVNTYLPTLAELQEVYAVYSVINPTIRESGPPYQQIPIIQVGKVWSSTEVDTNHAWAIDFTDGSITSEPKSSQLGVIKIAVKSHDYVLKLEYVDEYGSTTIIDLN